MSTLFNMYYDSFGNELTYGSMVAFKVNGGFVYGTVIDIVSDPKIDYKFVVVPNIGYKSSKDINLKKKYKISHNKIFLIKKK